MAAVTAPAPTATSRSPVSNTKHLRPLPLPLHDINDIHDMSTMHDLPPLPSPSTSGAHSPRIRQPAASPVRVSFHQENWAKPTNAPIEDYDLSSQSPLHSPSQSQSSDAPTPPPHADSDSRLSRGTTSTEQQQISTESSAATSTSSVDDNSLHNGMAAGAGGQTADGAANHHHHHQRSSTSNTMRRSSLPRPPSSYSVYSDFGHGRRLSSAQSSAPSSRKSPDQRPSSYADMLNEPYPQPGPGPITLDNAQLRTSVGTNASLLSAPETLEMYRQNVKKTTDPSIQYSFAVFLIATAQEQGLSIDEAVTTTSANHARDKPSPERSATPLGLVREARSILQRLSNAGYPFAQYYLADGYASGLFSSRSKEGKEGKEGKQGKTKADHHAAFPLFVLAAKHGHAESAYRTALCYEFGWGCRKDPAKAVQYLRTAAAKRHPGAMMRLGKACLSGDLGEKKRYREGIKWLKLATESADTIHNVAPYQLGCLYETGYGDDIFQDESYAAELFTQAAELGHAEANYRMGDAYEHGRLNCPCDPALSVHFYTEAAERGHAAAMMGLCAWYMVGAEPLLERDEEEAYEWARRAADLGHVKAQYTVGYFTEMGIGCRRDILEANVWYVQAADAGDKRATLRLQAIRAAVNGGLGGSGGTPMEVGPPRGGNKKEENCVVM